MLNNNAQHINLLPIRWSFNTVLKNQRVESFKAFIGGILSRFEFAIANEELIHNGQERSCPNRIESSRLTKPNSMP
jgi:hypothetical protein